MRPIVIKGHERPLSQLKYNREGDLLVSTARDKAVSVWFSDNGERLGTLPHEGAVFTVDIDSDTKICVTGAADNFVRVWGLKNGELLLKKEIPTTARFVELSPSGKQLLVIRENQRSYKSAIIIYDISFEDLSSVALEEKVIYELDATKSAYAQASWSFDEKHILAAHKDGSISKINALNGEVEVSKKIHDEPVTDLQMSPDRTYFVTSSRDKTSHLVIADSLEVIHTYLGDVPLNSAAITPIKDYIIAGGGIAAHQVTTSSNGKFESHFFHKLFEDDLARLGGHFGPINTIAVHPFGTSYASGSEDGYIRIHHFDQNYFDFDYGKTSDK